MRILIDINHPAHVHYFHNLYHILINNNHQVCITAKKKDITLKLLKNFDIPYYCTGKNKQTLIGKFLSIIKSDYIILKQSLKFKPDLFFSFFSLSASHIGTLLNKPVIAFSDTENAKLSIITTKPFTNVVLTPSCFTKNLGKKQIRFNGYMELCYLHPNYFIPDPSVLEILGVAKDEKYVIIRFVSWNASHDVGHSGLSLAMKHTIVRELSKYAKVFISSEGELPKDLKPYQIKIPPQKMHDALAFATLLYGESSTMASECACLGTPAFFIDNDGRGYTNEEEEKYGLVFNYSESFQDQKRSLRKALELLNTPNLKQEFQNRRQKMLADKIDVTAFMVWFVENYPQSVKIMKENPDYQYNFK